MRAETIPLILGVLVALIGLGLLADAWLPEKYSVHSRERRRSPREERHLGGEAALGLGTLCLAAALLSRDSWDYVNVVMIAGAVMILAGIWLNRRFLRDRIVNRGALRRADGPGAPKGEPPAQKRDTPRGRTRIR